MPPAPRPSGVGLGLSSPLSSSPAGEGILHSRPPWSAGCLSRDVACVWVELPGIQAISPQPLAFLALSPVPLCPHAEPQMTMWGLLPNAPPYSQIRPRKITRGGCNRVPA